MYEHFGRISIAFGYSRDIYTKAPGKSHQKQHRMKIRYCFYGVYENYTPFDYVELQKRYHANPFALSDALSQHVQYIFVQHMNN